MNEPIEPLCLFPGRGVEVFRSLDRFLGWVEATDVENGEYDELYDASGGRVVLTVTVDRVPRSRLLSAFGLGPRKVRYVESTYTPPTPAAQAEFADRLALALGLPQGTSLQHAVAMTSKPGHRSDSGV